MPAASITAAVPEPSSLAPGASEAPFITSLTRESRWPEMTITQFVGAADEALYKAKMAGKNRYVIAGSAESAGS